MRVVLGTLLLAGCQLWFPLDPENIPTTDATADALVDGDPPPADTTPDGPPATFKRVFVSAQRVSGSFGGVLGGDNICQDSADNQMRGGTWKAWLSDNFEDARDRMIKHALPYQLVTGVLVADNFSGLVSGALIHAIDVTELGGPQPETTTNCENGTGVWTGTTQLGMASSNNCGNWQGVGDGNAGSSIAIDRNWTEHDGCSGINCSALYSLYCIEQ